MKITTVEQFLKHKVAREQKPIVAKIRKLMKKWAPEAKEVISYGVLYWRQKRMIAVINPTKKKITFAFANGAKFEDKYGLLQGVGKVSKNVQIKEMKDVKEEALNYYVKQALKFEGE
jgi:hypothetical protein